MLHTPHTRTHTPTKWCSTFFLCQVIYWTALIVAVPFFSPNTFLHDVQLAMATLTVKLFRVRMNKYSMFIMHEKQLLSFICGERFAAQSKFECRISWQWSDYGVVQFGQLQQTHEITKVWEDLGDVPLKKKIIRDFGYCHFAVELSSEQLSTNGRKGKRELSSSTTTTTQKPKNRNLHFQYKTFNTFEQIRHEIQYNMLRCVALTYQLIIN